jgi:5-formyltetrahydrofolate cyclo-ligase
VTQPPGDDVALAEAKRTIRAEIRRRRATRTAAAKAADDTARTRRLVGLLSASSGAVVAAYLSAGTEPDSLGVVDWLATRRVTVLLPASTDGAWRVPAWARYAGADRLRPGPRGIPEPTSAVLPAEAIGRADVVICPGLAGTPDGDRLGRGGGWYDRALPAASGELILLLNDDEVRDWLPTGPLDRRVDAIVTPTRSLQCRSAGP